MQHRIRLCPPAFAFAAMWFLGCGNPEAFYSALDSGPGSGSDARTDSGGVVGSGGAGSGGRIGTGGSNSGGTQGTGGTGTGGAASGGRGTGGSASGGRGTGGAGTGGSSTGGRGPATGGTGNGGRGTGGAATGGTGNGGRGTGGAGTGGRATGGTGTGGRGTGGAGTAGATGTGPCMGLCGGAIVVAKATNSGPLGTGVTCHSVTGTIAGIVCGNFTAPRTFSVNGTLVNCGGTITVPAARGGGYCMQASAGNESFAYFVTY